MLRDACCSTSLYNVNRWQIEVVQHSFTLQDCHNRVSSELPVFATSRSSVHARHPFILFLVITVSALFVHYRWKINGSADIMAAFHTQKGWVGCLLQPYHLKIFCGLTTYHQQPSHAYGIHVINNLRV